MYSAQLSHSSKVEYIPRLSRIGFPDLPTSRRSEKFCIFRAPICNTSAYSPTQETSRVSTTSVTIGSPVSRRALSRILRPFSPRPWKAYGEVRGLKAPPRSICAPAFFTAIAVSMVCFSVSTEQGPAMITRSSPTFTPFTSIIVVFCPGLRAASLIFLNTAISLH